MVFASSHTAYPSGKCTPDKAPGVAGGRTASRRQTVGRLPGPASSLAGSPWRAWPQAPALERANPQPWKAGQGAMPSYGARLVVALGFSVLTFGTPAKGPTQDSDQPVKFTA